jgi:hypothetical protein
MNGVEPLACALRSGLENYVLFLIVAEIGTEVKMINQHIVSKMLAYH